MRIKNLYFIKYVIICLLLATNNSNAQNALRSNDGWGVGWNTNDFFSPTGFGSTFGKTYQNSSGSGQRYFRLFTHWDFGNLQYMHGPLGTNDISIPFANATTLDTWGANQGKAYFVNVSGGPSEYSYIFRTRSGNGYSNTPELTVFEVQGEVRSVSSIVQTPNAVTADQSVLINATLTGNLSTGQSVYLRFTTDDWLNSSIIEMDVEGSLATTTISPQPVGTVVAYYVFTSGSNLNISHSDADFFTINGNNNAGNNYQYTVEGLPSYVSVSPTFPKDNEPVTITFSAAGTPLQDASLIYLHSGISKSLSNPKLFQNVIGNWGQNDSIGAMTNIGVDLWMIELPSLRTLYNVVDIEDVFGLNFLFRNETGSLKEDNNGQNFFVPVDPVQYIVINSPQYNPFFVPTNQLVDIEVQANIVCDQWIIIELDPQNDIFFDTLVSANTASTFLSYTVSMDMEIERKFKIMARFDTLFKTKFLNIVGYAPPEILPRPTWTKLGVNYHSEDFTKVTLVLHCPVFTNFYDGNGLLKGTNPSQAKGVVYVVGDFNEWVASPQFKMHRDTGSFNDIGDFFWLEISGLQEGKEYVFQYLIDGTLQIADPYTHKVSDIDDIFISDDVFPNLISYPSEAQDRASVIQTNRLSYQWTADTFMKPTTDRLHIYELHFRDFTDEGTYLAAIERLDYIKGLGFNAIHVMPVSEFEGNNSWGYNPNFYFAADKAYGTENDLKKFIDECHKRKIQVFNDLVLNHAFYSNPMAKMYWNMELNRPSNDSPYFNPLHKMVRNPAGWWGADWNHESEHVQKMVDSIIGYWVTEFKFDGFRFDFTKGIGQTDPNDFPPGDDWASAYNQDRIDLLKRMVNRMWQYYPGTVTIFEHLASASEDKVLADFGILMWSGVGHHNAMKEFILGYEESNTNIYSSGVYNAPDRNFNYANWISYSESHDEERLAYETKNYFNWQDVSGSLDNADDSLSIIIKRLQIGLGFNLMLPGTRMMWQFQELGYDYSINHCPDGSINSNCRTSEKPVVWEYFEDPQRKKLFSLVKYLLKLRNERDLYTNINYGNIGLGANHRHVPRKMSLTAANGDKIIIVANLDPGTPRTVSPDYNTTGTWYRYNRPENLSFAYNVSNLSDTYTLQPNEVLVLSNYYPYKCTDVLSTANSGLHTLREALSCANDGDIITIDFDLFDDTITLDTPIFIDKNVTIQGFPSKRLYIDGRSMNVPVFHIGQSKNVTFLGLSILCSEQNNLNGRCILNHGNVTLDDVDLKGIQNLQGGFIDMQDGHIWIKRNVALRE